MYCWIVASWCGVDFTRQLQNQTILVLRSWSVLVIEEIQPLYTEFFFRNESQCTEFDRAGTYSNAKNYSTKKLTLRHGLINNFKKSTLRSRAFDAAGVRSDGRVRCDRRWCRRGRKCHSILSGLPRNEESTTSWTGTNKHSSVLCSHVFWRRLVLARRFLS